MMTTLIEIEDSFNTIEDRLMADLAKAKERAKLLGEIPHTVSLTTYFNNEIIGVDARQFTTDGIPEDDPITLTDDADLKALINGVIDTRLAERSPYFQPDHDKLVTWEVLSDVRSSLEQWVIHSHGRAVQDIDRQCAELRQRLKDTRIGMVGLAIAVGILLALAFAGVGR